MNIEVLKAERPHLAAELDKTFSMVRGIAAPSGLTDKTGSAMLIRLSFV